MISSFQPSKVLILLLASCLIWIGGISLAVAFFLGTAVTTGWIIAGGLVLAALAWALVMFREIRDAIELPDYLANEGTKGHRAHRTPNVSSMGFRSEMRDAFERPALENRRAARRFRHRLRGARGTLGPAEAKR